MTEGMISLAMSRQEVDLLAEKYKKRPRNRFMRGLKIVSEWCHQESNRGHKDFQSFALPTELWHRLFCVLVMQRYDNFLN